MNTIEVYRKVQKTDDFSILTSKKKYPSTGTYQSCHKIASSASKTPQTHNFWQELLQTAETLVQADRDQAHTALLPAGHTHRIKAAVQHARLTG